MPLQYSASQCVRSSKGEVVGRARQQVRELPGQPGIRPPAFTSLNEGIPGDRPWPLWQGHELGELYYIDSARLNLGLYQNDVNVILDLAPHDVSIINYVLGRKPVAAAAWACRHAHFPG